MTDRKLNDEIATKVMEWHSESVCYPHSDERFDNWVDANGVGRYTVERGPNQWLPCEFIVQAMLIVEKMHERGFTVLLRYANTWYVEFSPRTVNPQQDFGRVKHESLSRAICLAALSAINGNEEK